MDGAGSRSSQHSLSNYQENGNGFYHSLNPLSFISQGPDQRSSTAPQNILAQSINSITLVVTPASGTSTGNLDSNTITHRIDNKLHFDVTMFGLPLQGGFFRIPLTRSVKRRDPATGLCHLNLSFELRGAETRKIREFACQRCKNKISRDLDSLSRVDFTENQDTIALENGKARISLRFTCYPSHDDNGTGVGTDKEYIIQAILKDGLQVEIARYEIPNRFKVARYANGPTKNRGKSRGSRCSRLSQDGVRQANGSLGSTGLVSVTPPLDVDPSTVQSSAHAFLLRPLNVVNNPAPLPPPAAPQEPHSHIQNHTPEVTSIDVRPTEVYGNGAIGLLEISRHVPGANSMVQKDLRPSGVLENESRVNEAINQNHSHDLHVSPGIYDTLQPGTGPFTMHQPLDVPNPMGVVSNTSTRGGEDIMLGVFHPAEEPLQVLPPSLQHESTDWIYPYQLGAPAPISNAGVTSATHFTVPTTLCDSLPSSATTILPPTEGSSNRSDHRPMRHSPQQDTTQEPSPCAEYVAPSKGPLSGGVEVTIVGTNFPHTLPLSVYFGMKLAVVTRNTRETIRCVVPAASSPGLVDLRILVEPPGLAPEVDCNMAKFTYEDERMTELMMHVKFIASRRNPALWEATVTLMQRAVEAAMEQASGGLEPGASNALQSLDYRQFEEVAIKILSSYSTYHDWKRAVSCPNEYGQTLAHLAVTLGYTRLLERLIYWGIDLSVRDATGATALRFYDHPDCVALLNRNGANQQIRDGSPPPEDSGSGCPTIPGLSARDDASTILTESVSPPPYTKSPSEAEHHYTLRQAPSRAQNWNSQPASPPNVMLLSPPPSAVRVHPNHVRIRHRLLHYPKILGKIFAYSSSLHLRAEAPFLQDHTTKPWLESLRDLKSLCLVSRTFHTSAAPLLYTHIRLRRIPQLSALVVSLQLNYKRVSKSRTFTPSLRLGECTQSLDLSFFIPKEWNTLYVNDLIALLSMLPNLTSFRSRPCLPMLSQSGVPLPRPVPSSILLALAHSLRNNSLLNELELTQQESPALADLTTLLQNSVNLTTLTLGLYIFDSGSALSTAPASIRLPSLQSLRLHVTMNRPKGVLTARPAAHFMVDAIRWAMPKLRNLSLVLDHDIQALSSDSSFGGILHGFLNMHGHGLQHLSITETAPHLRSRELDVSSLVSKCPVLECLTVGIVGCAPVRMVVPHIRLRRVQFVGTFGWISGGGDVLREHGRRALKIQADEVRTGKFPGLRDIVLTDEREVPRGWTEVMRSVKVSIMCLRASEEGDENVWSDGEGSDDEDWIPSPSEGDDDLSSEGDEDDGWYTDAYAAGHGADGEKSDHEMVKNPSGRTTSYTGDDQIDHQGALEIFKKTLERIVGLPKNEDPNNEADNAGPPALVRVSLPVVVPAPIPTKVSTPASLQYQHPSSSPTHHRRLNSGAGDLSRTTTVSGHQRKLSKDQGLNRIHPSAPPSAHFGLLPVVGSLRGNSSAQGHHRRLSNGGERPTLPPLSLSAQQSHTVPITITSPTPSSSKGAPTPTFTFGSSSRGAEAKADGDEGTVGSARRKVLKTGSLKWKPQP